MTLSVGRANVPRDGGVPSAKTPANTESGAQDVNGCVIVNRRRAVIPSQASVSAPQDSSAIGASSSVPWGSTEGTAARSAAASRRSRVIT